jgi:hypothetical protein
VPPAARAVALIARAASQHKLSQAGRLQTGIAFIETPMVGKHHRVIAVFRKSIAGVSMAVAG